MLKRKPMFAALLLVLGGVAVFAAPSIKARKPEFVGQYDVTFAGEWAGQGKATVHADDVKFNVQTVDSAGNKVHLKSGKLDLDQGRFNGDGTADGVPVLIRGRVEEQVTGDAPRLVGLVIDPANRKYARFAGVRRGS